ncbi:MAG TPA: hypothetical protein VHR45_15870 [Thermoanaerobaculia bacterium]|nr:hypothetical protein [Thermoanaerobaculia bacterium]
MNGRKPLAVTTSRYPAARELAAMKRTALVAAMLLALLANGGTAQAAPAAICDSNTTVTLIGMDTDSGRMLFSVAAPAAAQQGQGAWIVDLDGAGRQARGYPDSAAGLFGGSVGPGPVLAVAPCGADCLQPVRWSEGSWEPLGDTLTVPAATLAATYDSTGAAWILAHGKGAAEGQVRAWAFRFENRQWKAYGALEVAAVGQPQTLPAPQRQDGVTSGTGLFSASAAPRTWVQGLPGLAANRRGQVIALAGTSAAYLSADGVAYLSADGGKSWRRSVWTPWSTGGAPDQAGGDATVGMWRQGTDYGVDLPFGDHRGALRLVWFDRRNPAEEKVLLTRLTVAGDWVLVGEAPAEVRSKSGERLPITQVLVPHGDSWLLLSGCAATAEGSGLVLRTYEGGQMSAPRFVPIETRGRPGAAPPPSWKAPMRAPKAAGPTGW